MSALETIIDPHRVELSDLCRSFGVARLELFGSAATAEFDPAGSDIDLLVEFFPGQDLGPWLSQYFELRDRLEALLGRKVDLVLSAAVTNPYFARELNRTRRLLYAA
jgi:uncharacterized protein